MVDYKTICALATPQGSGALAVIRLSGDDTFAILDSVFKPVGKINLSKTSGNRIRFGTIGVEKIIDEVLVSIFRAPHSYTGEDCAEISCHCSDYIVSEILQLLTKSGAHLAQPGEFTRRAFLNGKMDLSQAEAVADVIACETEASHDVAMRQMRGGFSNELQSMRQALLDIVSLMELELDFSEEDVEFADRTQLKKLLAKVSKKINSLTESFKLGNVIKNGVPVAIVGATNTGKSTLLNTLLSEERAIVSNIPGTTRDSIEETTNIDGITFRFIDTAGIRATKGAIEIIGIERTYAKMRQASIILLLLDAIRPETFQDSLTNLSEKLGKSGGQHIIILLNKIDLPAPKLEDANSDVEQKDPGEDLEGASVAGDSQAAFSKWIKLRSLAEKSSQAVGIHPFSILPISAKYGQGIDQLKKVLLQSQKSLKHPTNATLITNLRHYEALTEAQSALSRVSDGLKNNIPTDLITQDLREALYHIGTITGEITSDEILGNIFGKFCIGK